MNEKILDLIRKYNINPWKIAVFVVLLFVVVFTFFVTGNIINTPAQAIFNFYAYFLIAQSKLILHFSNIDFTFDFVKNQIINHSNILKIDRFYFSLFQIFAALTVVIITKSTFLNKVFSFLAAFFILSLYNALRISIHAIYPETIAVHNWIFNLILIPRWLIVLAFAWYYWNKFPGIFKYVKLKFNFNDVLIKKTFIKIAVIIVSYYLVVILIFNDIIFLNGTLLISFILNLCKYFIELLGYNCWINNRLIYGNVASLYMDDACMGINLMFLFASFIALLPGATKHKLWYIPLGLVIIVLLNCLRIIMIFVNVTAAGKYTMFIEIHDLYTYPVLVFTFIMWVIWMNKFYKPKTLPKSRMPELPN